MLLDGKVALVTGASRGIGRAIALRLASEGAKVAINYAGSTAKAEAVKAEIEQNGGEAILVQADVSDSASVDAMVAKVIEAFGQIDILVNNAGITRDGLMMRMKDEDFDAVINTNLKGVFYCTKVVSKLMMKEAQWPHHQYGIGCWPYGQCRPDELRCSQGWCHRFLEIGRQGTGCPRYHGQHGCTGIHCYRYDGCR
jgi:NAD(P)-dependent dehydrogenase (short-subunit alcohol dehydrogenase family)